jgi:hypothetical protein
MEMRLEIHKDNLVLKWDQAIKRNREVYYLSEEWQEGDRN